MLNVLQHSLSNSHRFREHYTRVANLVYEWARLRKKMNNNINFLTSLMRRSNLLNLGSTRANKHAHTHILCPMSTFGKTNPLWNSSPRIGFFFSGSNFTTFNKLRLHKSCTHTHTQPQVIFTVKSSKVVSHILTALKNGPLSKIYRAAQSFRPSRGSLINLIPCLCFRRKRSTLWYCHCHRPGRIWPVKLNGSPGHLSIMRSSCVA